MAKLLRQDRPWSDYPMGTKAYSIGGGHWVRVEQGWKWFCGATFPTPGGDAIGRCIELPTLEPPSMTQPLSPAAQAVMDAVIPTCGIKSGIAAALRAAADQPYEVPAHYIGEAYWIYRQGVEAERNRNLAIAAELEGDTSTSSTH